MTSLRVCYFLVTSFTLSLPRFLSLPPPPSFSLSLPPPLPPSLPLFIVSLSPFSEFTLPLCLPLPLPLPLFLSQVPPALVTVRLSASTAPRTPRRTRCFDAYVLSTDPHEQTRCVPPPHMLTLTTTPIAGATGASDGATRAKSQLRAQRTPPPPRVCARGAHSRIPEPEIRTP